MFGKGDVEDNLRRDNEGAAALVKKLLADRAALLAVAKAALEARCPARSAAAHTERVMLCTCDYCCRLDDACKALPEHLRRECEP